MSAQVEITYPGYCIRLEMTNEHVFAMERVPSKNIVALTAPAPIQLIVDCNTPGFEATPNIYKGLALSLSLAIPQGDTLFVPDGDFAPLLSLQPREKNGVCVGVASFYGFFTTVTAEEYRVNIEVIDVGLIPEQEGSMVASYLTAPFTVLLKG
ncbi:uncharacterized protein I303_100316 [Kwoniella dejecticola CBS 10117]|uniref:Uncharacterized protein n=1 Tax=Kwoniella dejecticola CBS 10117 TaxID=1296121 RepID=A0A1A6AEM8_9TREE|nr:uncharacterized protein I303_00316 [Kwoniella dejecticola CBS 10117]OBR88499.1 hypothetical protein I303_00316 [Kwoniella dejecticola CBS 10117]